MVYHLMVVILLHFLVQTFLGCNLGEAYEREDIQIFNVKGCYPMMDS